VTGRSLGYRVILVRVGEPRAALHEPREPSGHLRTESSEVVSPEAIDSYHDDEGGAARRRGLRICDCRNDPSGSYNCGAKMSEHAPI
jgi:hypothetical protein